MTKAYYVAWLFFALFACIFLIGLAILHTEVILLGALLFFGNLAYLINESLKKENKSDEVYENGSVLWITEHESH